MPHADHDRHSRRQSKRAGTGDNQRRNGRHKPAGESDREFDPNDHGPLHAPARRSAFGPTPNARWDRVNALGRFANRNLLARPPQAALNRIPGTRRKWAVAASDRPLARASRFGGEKTGARHNQDCGKSGSGDRLGIYPLARGHGCNGPRRRDWRGFRRHMALCVAAHGFPVSERRLILPSSPQTGFIEAARLSPVCRPRRSAIRPERLIVASIATLGMSLGQPPRLAIAQMSLPPTRKFMTQ